MIYTAEVTMNGTLPFILAMDANMHPDATAEILSKYSLNARVNHLQRGAEAREEDENLQIVMAKIGGSETKVTLKEDTWQLPKSETRQ